MQDHQGPASRLTYADVHRVLALLQGWDRGTLSLQYNGLTVDAVMAAAPAPPAIRLPRSAYSGRKPKRECFSEQEIR
jgi:hypothetical protein